MRVEAVCMSGVTFFSAPQFTLSFSGNSVLGVKFPTSVQSVLRRQQYDMCVTFLSPLRFRVSFCGSGESGVTFHHQVRNDSFSSSFFSLFSSGSK